MSLLVIRCWSVLSMALRGCERRATQAPLRFSLLTVSVLLTIAIAVFQPSYDTNDDVFMTMIVAGKGFCPAPDHHLIFTNVIIGQALMRLYTAWPQVPWYGCYLLSVHCLAQVVLLYCALVTDRQFGVKTEACGALTSGSGRLAASARASTRLRLSLYLIYFVLVELPFLNSLQFTTTAFLAAQAGVFLLLIAVRRRASQPGAAVALSLSMAVFLLVVAGLIRFESLSMALLATLPVGFAFARGASLKSLIPGGLAATSAAMLLVLALTYDKACYQHDARWSGFFSYNRLRVKFNDYRWTSYNAQTASAFSAVGWSKNDHEMIAHWFFDDPVVYSEANLRSILEARSWITERLTTEYCWQVCRGLLRDRSIWAVLLALPFFVASIDRIPSARWATISSAIIAVSLIAFLHWTNKLVPARVYFPLLSFPLSVPLLFSLRSEKANSFRVEPDARDSNRPLRGFSMPLSGRAVVILLIVGVVMGVHHQCRRSVRVLRDRRVLQAFLADLRDSGHDLYVCWESAMPFELVSPLDNFQSWSQMPLVNLAWTQRTPWQEGVKRRFGISSLAQAMCDRQDIVLVATPEHRSLFTTFAREHVNADIEFVSATTAGEKLVAGRFQRRATLPENASERTGAVQR